MISRAYKKNSLISMISFLQDTRNILLQYLLSFTVS